jgi:hypothetical protein
MEPADSDLNSKPAAGAEALDVLDLGFLRDWGGFAVDALRGHKARAATAFVGLFAAAMAWLAWGPRIYRTQTVILAQRNQVIPYLANPRRAVPSDSDTPTWAARETVLRRENLVSLIKETDLLDQWQSSRPPLLEMKDTVSSLFSGHADEAEALDNMVGTLQTHLEISAKEGTVTIAINWPDSTMAYRLVEAAQQNFLEARHAAEVSAIAESIAILEQNVADARTSVQALVGDQTDTASDAGGARGIGPSRKRDDSDANRLRILADAKQRTIDDLEEFRRKRLGELQVKLAEERTVYAAAHPVIAATEQSILALSQESPQVARLRREQQELRSQITSLSSTAEPAPGLHVEADGRAVAALPPRHTTQDGPAREYAEQRLRIEVGKYEDLLDRASAARIELEATRAAFKFRYSVIEPPSVPKKRTSPKVPPFVAGSLVLALLGAVAVAVFADLRAGRIARSWQVERQLGLPVVGEVEIP